MKPARRAKIIFGLLALATFSTAGKAWYDTMRTPVVMRVETPFLQSDGVRQPHRIILLADLHVAGPDMPPERLERIVAQVNTLRPDVVLMAGDFISDKRTSTKRYSTAQALAPLGRLDPGAAKIAVPGNHDHWRDIESIGRELSRLRITVLRNQVVSSSGLVVGGLDDDFTGHADLPAVVRTLERTDSHAVVLSHSPDPFPDLPPDTGIMLAGHTHCGQIAWPWGGSPATMSKYGQRYACGVVKERGNILITSAGLGTSVLPFRLFTQPEIWVIDLVQPKEKAAGREVRRPVSVLGD